MQYLPDEKNGNPMGLVAIAIFFSSLTFPLKLKPPEKVEFGFSKFTDSDEFMGKSVSTQARRFAARTWDRV